MVGVIFFSGSDLMFLKDSSKNDFSVNGKTKSRIKIKTEQQKRIEMMIKWNNITIAKFHCCDLFSIVFSITFSCCYP